MYPNKGIEFASNALIAQKLSDLGPTSPQENMFCICPYRFPMGISHLNQFFLLAGLSDTMISVGCAIALFSIPHQFKKESLF